MAVWEERTLSYFLPLPFFLYLADSDCFFGQIMTKWLCGGKYHCLRKAVGECLTVKKNSRILIPLLLTVFEETYIYIYIILKLNRTNRFISFCVR